MSLSRDNERKDKVLILTPGGQIRLIRLKKQTIETGQMRDPITES